MIGGDPVEIRTRQTPNMPVPVVARSKVWVCGRSLTGIMGSNPAGDMDVRLLWMLCCQVEVSATGWSLVKRSPTDCGASNWMWSWILHNEEDFAHEGCCAMVKKNTEYKSEALPFQAARWVSSLFILCYTSL